ncbi:MAG TPA: hypothetical protein VI076_05500 [Actinopolymorphaceae bacterium]
MPSIGVPFLLICGPPGVGKSTVSWAVFDELPRAGRRMAEPEPTPLGMSSPDGATTTGRGLHITRSLHRAPVPRGVGTSVASGEQPLVRAGLLGHVIKVGDSTRYARWTDEQGQDHRRPSARNRPPWRT